MLQYLYLQVVLGGCQCCNYCSDMINRTQRDKLSLELFPDDWTKMQRANQKYLYISVRLRFVANHGIIFVKISYLLFPLIWTILVDITMKNITNWKLLCVKSLGWIGIYSYNLYCVQYSIESVFYELLILEKYIV